MCSAIGRKCCRDSSRFSRTSIEPDPSRVPPGPEPEDLERTQRAFGYGFEDLRYGLEPMGASGADAVWSMGDDTPIPPLAKTAPSVYAYFRQRFAQVTNPPIDSLRESMVMSLRVHLGRRESPLLERPSYARMLRIEHPIMLPEEMAALHNVAGFSAVGGASITGAGAVIKPCTRIASSIGRAWAR